MTGLMAREIAEIPEAARRLVEDGAAMLDAVAARIQARPFSHVVICGRGSSGHAGVFLRYLIETRLGVAVSHSAPSVVTGYRGAARLDQALFILISQSGRSPDLVAATKAARDGGAMTLALLNVEQSPAAEVAHAVLPILAGPEKAVAATKSVVNSMVAGAALVARLTDDAALLARLAALPARLEAAQALDWSAWTATLAQARAAYVTGRGHGYGPVREIALKMAETLELPTLGYSSAELLHGPRAAVHPDTPVLVLRQNDAVSEGIDTLARDLTTAGVPTSVCGGPEATLPWIGDGDAVTDPIAMLVPAYRAIEAEARRRGLDPDAPRGLRKVTETL